MKKVNKKVFSIVLCFALVLTSLFSLTIVSSAVEQGSWTVKSLQTARVFFGAVSLNGKIYAFGGENNASSFFNSIEEYNPLTNKWTYKTNMPSNISEAGNAVVCNGKIYYVGGYDGTSLLNKIREYDPIKNKWNTKTTTLNTLTLDPAVAVVNNKIYIIGGRNATDFYSTIEEYDPATGNKRTMSSTIPNKAHASVAVFNGKVYIMGGYASGSGLASVHRFDPVNDTMTAMGNMTSTRFHASAVVLDGFIYVFGGRIGGTASNSVERYDPDNDTWVTMANMPLAREGVRAVELNGKVYLLGGRDASNVTLSSVELYHPAAGPKALLKVSFTNGLTKEFDSNLTEIDEFVNWYDLKSNGSTNVKSYFVFAKNNIVSIIPYLSKKEYVVFDKIVTFDVFEYTADN